MRELSDCELELVSGGLNVKGFDVQQLSAQVVGSSIFQRILVGAVDADSDAEKKFTEAYGTLYNSPTAKIIIDALSDDGVSVIMNSGKINMAAVVDGVKAGGISIAQNTVLWDPGAAALTDDGDVISPSTFLIHELAHLYLEQCANAAYGYQPKDYWDKVFINTSANDLNGSTNLHERFAWAVETAVAKELNMGTRSGYTGAGSYHAVDDVNESTETDWKKKAILAIA